MPQALSCLDMLSMSSEFAMPFAQDWPDGEAFLCTSLWLTSLPQTSS